LKKRKNKHKKAKKRKAELPDNGPWPIKLLLVWGVRCAAHADQVGK
jgi:hypothetical protein